jgi:hypothetical protein
MDDKTERRGWGNARFWLGGGLVVAVVATGVVQLTQQDSTLRTLVLGASAKKPDTTPPSVSITSPVPSGSYNAATWGTVTGTASDATGVAKVEVRLDGGNYVTANGTTSWSWSFPRPSDGPHTILVRATDTATPVPNTSDPISVSVQVDTVAPAVPTITATPDNPTFDTNPQFAFRDGEAGVTFECQLDGAAGQPCNSPVNYKKISIGDHTFRAVALDAAGNRSNAAAYNWTVLENKSFGITGSVTGLFSPGVIQPLNLVLSNPYNFAITVSSVTVSVDPATTKTSGAPNPACLGTTNLTVTQQLAATVTLPPNGTKSLSELSVDPANWPTLQMPDLPTNQDACKNTTFKLSYTGTATKS